MTVLLTALATSHLLLRQQRIDLAYRTAVHHGQLERIRYELWNTQTRAGKLLTPDSLERQVRHSQVQLEPAVPESQSSRGVMARREP